MSSFRRRGAWGSGEAGRAVLSVISPWKARGREEREDSPGTDAPSGGGLRRISPLVKLVALVVMVSAFALLPSDHSLTQTPVVDEHFALNADEMQGEGVRLSLVPPEDGEPLKMRFEFEEATVRGLKLSGLSEASELPGGEVAANQRAPGPVKLKDLTVEATGASFAVSGGCLEPIDEQDPTNPSAPVEVGMSDVNIESTRMTIGEADFSSDGSAPALSISAGPKPITEGEEVIRTGDLGGDSLVAAADSVNGSLESLLSGESGLCGSSDSTFTSGPTPQTTANAIPEHYLEAYRAAGEEYGLDWAILAAIGKVESDHGYGGQRNSCITGPLTSYGTAKGPMQFLDSTWAVMGVDANGDGRKDRCNYEDAIFGAANYLDQSGAPEDYREAIFTYNNSEAYVEEVLAQAEAYRNGNVVPTSGGSYGGCPTTPTADSDTEVQGNNKAVFPLPEEYFGDYRNDYGNARPAFTGGGGMHEGTDIFTPKGEPIYSIASGVVRSSTPSNSNDYSYSGGYNVMVVADESVGPIREGDYLFYAHMTEPPAVSPGERVEAGQLLGRVGATGYGNEVTRDKFDPHLHLGWYDRSDSGRSQKPSGAMNPFPLLEWLRENGGTATGADAYTPSPAECGPSSGSPSDTVLAAASPGQMPQDDPSVDASATASRYETSGQPDSEPSYSGGGKNENAENGGRKYGGGEGDSEQNSQEGQNSPQGGSQTPNQSFKEPDSSPEPDDGGQEYRQPREGQTRQSTAPGDYSSSQPGTYQRPDGNESSGSERETQPDETRNSGGSTSPEPTQSEPARQEPTRPAPTRPVPTQPEPTEPEPTEPAPTQPEPTRPEPTQPAPTRTEPTEPEPSLPVPTRPEPTQPEPTEPEPTQPAPILPAPTRPVPTQPEPTEPAPTQPEPTQPEPDGDSGGSDEGSLVGDSVDEVGGVVEGASDSLLGE